MRSFLVIILGFPFALFSQNKRIVFVESGISINQSFYPKETLSEYSYYWDGKGPISVIGYQKAKISRNTTFSFYSKIGIEVPITQKKHFSISCPFIFGYREQKQNFNAEIEQVYYGSVPYKYSLNEEYYSRIFSFIFGPKATMNFNKWGYFTSVNFNADLFVFERITTITNNDFGSFEHVYETGAYTENDFMFNLSLQNGIFYNINSKISIGLTGDIFFYNIDPDVIRYSKKDNHLFNFGYGTNSTIINTGIRLQYSF
jgi:hypothetical protein